MSPDRTGRNHDCRRPPILKSLQINPIGTAAADRRHQAETVPDGGYRALAAASDHHPARLVFQNTSVLIAE